MRVVYSEKTQGPKNQPNKPYQINQSTILGMKSQEINHKYQHQIVSDLPDSTDSQTLNL